MALDTIVEVCQNGQERNRLVAARSDGWKRARKRGRPPSMEPSKCLTTLIGTDNETVLRWSILAVALLLDPAAVLLSVAGRRA
jgi:hypothetical protein